MVRDLVNWIRKEVKGRVIEYVYKRMSIKFKLGKDRREVSSFFYLMKKVWDLKNLKVGVLERG